MNDSLAKLSKEIGSGKEFEMFLEKIRETPAEQFAVLKISGETLESHFESIAEKIAALNSLNIYPIVIHGAGATLDKKLPFSKKINGLRVTGEADIPIIKDVFGQLNKSLVERINAKGGSAICLEGLLECDILEGYGLVGEVKKVDSGLIISAIKSGKTPIISPIGEWNGVLLNINADSAAKEIAKAIQPKKFILLTETGGVLDENGKIIPFINASLEEELEGISGGMLLKIKELSDFLKSMPDCSAVITSAENLLKEIFTIEGSGTFIKLYSINSAENIGETDVEKLKALLEQSFGKKLVEGYFDNGIKEIFFEKDYCGAAVIKEIDGIAYMDKFAVHPTCQGTGLGKSLWAELSKKYPKIVWRSSSSNPINGFYFKKCHGLLKKNDWIVYWKNLESYEVFPLSEKAALLEKTMVEAI